jgi:hypothetical protein
MIGIRVWQRSKQDGVDDAEDGGVGADAEREREHGKDAEPGMLEKLTKCESEIVHVD